MLRLEKSKTSQIILRLQKQVPFFSSTLILALTIAIGIHLTCFLLFKISFSSFEDPGLIPPVRVEAESINFSNASNDFTTTSYGLLLRPIEKLHYSAPTKVTAKRGQEFIDLSANKSLFVEVPSFHQIERSLYIDDEEEGLKTSPAYQMKIALSPELSSFAIQNLEEALKGITFEKDEKVSYLVQLEANKGRLFTIKGEEMKYEKFLKALRFEKKKEEGIIDGIISLSIEEKPAEFFIENAHDRD